MRILEYKGYKGEVSFDSEEGLFHAEVIDIRDVITFQGRSVEEIEDAFRDSVDDYLGFCQERSEEPDKPFSGRLMVRLNSRLHRRLYQQAREEGNSLDQLVSERLGEAV